MIEENLKLLGLNSKEIAVYLTIVQHGKLSHSAIAKLAGIKRTTAYNVVNTLAEKLLVTEDLGGETTYVTARPFEEASSLVRQDEVVLERKKRAIKELLPELVQLSGSSQYSLPRIQFVDEKHLEKHLFEATPKWDASLLQYDGTWWGFQDKTFVKHYEKWIDWYWETGSNPKTQLRLLSNESAENIKIKKFERRQIKLWNSGGDYSATVWINGDFVVMIVTAQKPHYLVEIYDKVLAHNLREHFKSIWDIV